MLWWCLCTMDKLGEDLWVVVSVTDYQWLCYFVIWWVVFSLLSMILLHHISESANMLFTRDADKYIEWFVSLEMPFFVLQSTLAIWFNFSFFFLYKIWNLLRWTVYITQHFPFRAILLVEVLQYVFLNFIFSVLKNGCNGNRSVWSACYVYYWSVLLKLHGFYYILYCCIVCVSQATQKWR
jgi:hypothetical protein